mgnify:CR=1 FL=1
MQAQTDKFEQLRQGLDVAYFGRQRCGFRCDPHQRDLLRRSTKRTILNCSRQIGKSTVAALKAVHMAHFHPGVTVVVTSPTKRQSRELIRKARTFALLCGSSRKGGRESVEFKNGSRIIVVAADEDTVRGYSAVALLIVDEAARVHDEVYFALLPMLAVSEGAVWLLSTPKGKRGFFYAEWSTPDVDSNTERWAKLKTIAEECPRIHPEFLKQQRRRIGERRFMQDYECYFLETAQGMFHPETVRNAFKETISIIDL